MPALSNPIPTITHRVGGTTLRLCRDRGFDEDRIDLAETAHPLAGRHFPDLDTLQNWMINYIATGVRRGRDARYSASLAMLHGLSSAFSRLVELVNEE